MQQIENLEQATRGQSSNKLWFQYRSGRITASKFKAASNTNLSMPSQTVLWKYGKGPGHSIRRLGDSWAARPIQSWSFPHLIIWSRFMFSSSYDKMKINC